MSLGTIRRLSVDILLRIVDCTEDLSDLALTCRSLHRLLPGARDGTFEQNTAPALGPVGRKGRPDALFASVEEMRVASPCFGAVRRLTVSSDVPLETLEALRNMEAVHLRRFCLLLSNREKSVVPNGADRLAQWSSVLCRVPKDAFHYLAVGPGDVRAIADRLAPNSVSPDADESTPQPRRVVGAPKHLFLNLRNHGPLSDAVVDAARALTKPPVDPSAPRTQILTLVVSWTLVEGDAMVDLLRAIADNGASLREVRIDLDTPAPAVVDALIRAAPAVLGRPGVLPDLSVVDLAFTGAYRPRRLMDALADALLVGRPNVRHLRLEMDQVESTRDLVHALVAAPRDLETLEMRVRASHIKDADEEAMRRALRDKTALRHVTLVVTDTWPYRTRGATNWQMMASIRAFVVDVLRGLAAPATAGPTRLETLTLLINRSEPSNDCISHHRPGLSVCEALLDLCTERCAPRLRRASLRLSPASWPERDGLNLLLALLFGRTTAPQLESLTFELGLQQEPVITGDGLRTFAAVRQNTRLRELDIDLNEVTGDRSRLLAGMARLLPHLVALERLRIGMQSLDAVCASGVNAIQRFPATLRKLHVDFALAGRDTVDESPEWVPFYEAVALRSRVEQLQVVLPRPADRLTRALGRSRETMRAGILQRLRREKRAGDATIPALRAIILLRDVCI